MTPAHLSVECHVQVEEVVVEKTKTMIKSLYILSKVPLDKYVIYSVTIFALGVLE